MNENSHLVSELYGSRPPESKPSYSSATALQRSLRALEDSLRAVARQENRLHPRVKTSVRIRVDLYPPGLHDYSPRAFRRSEMKLCDLSLSGARLRTSAGAVDIGDRLVLHLPYPRHPDIVLEGFVIRALADEKGVSLGVRFDSMDTSTMSRLGALLRCLAPEASNDRD